MGRDSTQCSAAGVARRVRDGERSPVDVVDDHLERIRERNERTNAFVTVAEESAREAAREAERAIDEGEPLGPLHGVPVAVKDIDDVAGIETTSGSLLLEDRVADADTAYVARLKAAGAIVVGKTNAPEFGVGTTTDNRVVGPTSTPFDLERTAGGSSGGAGAALADRLVPLAPGSDTGGSIRIPASACGVYGLKPTYGLVPNVDRPNAFASHTPFYHVGPMTRTVEDAALALSAMAGTHRDDPHSVPATDDYLAAVGRPIDDLRIAYSPDLGVYPLEPAVRETIDDAVDSLERAGATVEEVDPEFGHDREEILEAFYAMATVRWQATLDELEAAGYDPRGEDRDRLHDAFVETVVDATPPTVRKLTRADVVRSRLFDGLQDRFEEFDLIASATLATTPFPHGEAPTTIDGVDVSPRRGWVLTQPYNLTGHPAASVPAGFVDGLPVGLQLAGARFGDADVLAASAALERRRPWRDRYPA
ncbi:amidase [Natronococcus jeotgali]|uniref:Amidase n=1 Tax=Natronococcus jeotgali DSM 18795 TaxID=1227498 RepID=L9XV76_9EURY|nr:amidase [Natronococcus jeotgali]ELY65417.1 amidase [Natronococcus jeotgali DSM 18795]